MQTTDQSILTEPEQNVYAHRMMSSGSVNQGVYMAITAIEQKTGRIFFSPENQVAQIWKMFWSPQNGTPVILLIGAYIPLSGQYMPVECGTASAKMAAMLQHFKLKPRFQVDQQTLTRLNSGWLPNYSVAELCNVPSDEHQQAKAAFDNIAEAIKNATQPQ